MRMPGYILRANGPKKIDRRMLLIVKNGSLLERGMERWTRQKYGRFLERYIGPRK